jgi:hypothetical protein
MTDEPLTYAQMSPQDRAKVRKEMMRQVKVALKGSAMTPKQVAFAVRGMVDQALSREMQHGKTERSSTQ